MNAKNPKIPPFNTYYSVTDPAAFNNWKNDFIPESSISHTAFKLSHWNSFLEEKGIDYLQLRRKQQQSWALKKVYYGISLSQEKNYTDAIVSYSQAIQISPECIEAFVARGAAHANMHHWEDAVKDLKRALELDPKCENAKKYLQEVEEKIHVLERERNSAERGEYLMELEKPISLKKEPEKLGSVAPLWGRGPQAPSESFVPLNFEPVSSSSSEGDDKSDESNENRKRSKKKGKDDRKERKKKKKRRNYSDEDESGSDGCVKRSKKKHKKKKKK